MPGIEVDGNDVLAVYAAAQEAIQHARTGAGPTLMECKTYRTRPHAEGMGGFTYRTREEVEEWKARCPITLFKEKIRKRQIAAEAELKRIEAEVAKEIGEAMRFAETSPWPDPTSACAHVHAS
jgi:2-oxoisovalerate dehydrogenase E1 component